MKRDLKAFTLVELLVSMAIIGVLLGLSLYGISAAQRNSRDTARKNALTEFNAAVQDFYTKQGSYPSYLSLDTTGVLILGVSSADASCAASTQSSTCVRVQIRGAAVPTERIAINSNAFFNGTRYESTGSVSPANTPYCFSAKSDGYAISVKLENGVVYDAGTSQDRNCFAQ